jgi:hypothetical protein
MNALDRIFVNVFGRTKAAWILGGLAAASLLAGCAVGRIANTKMDPNSPVAAEAAKIARADSDYPSFREIPPKPTDVAPPRIYGDRARALEVARIALDRNTAPDTWTLSNTEAFAARARAEAGPDLGAPASTDTESFAREARKRATPPPPRQ